MYNNIDDYDYDTIYLLFFECERCGRVCRHIYLEPDDFNYYCKCGNYYKKECRVPDSCIKNKKVLNIDRWGCNNGTNRN